MKTLFVLILALSVAGCSAAPKMAPGKSAAQILVKAEPKKGFHPPTGGASYGGGTADQLASPANPGGPFVTLDYANLYNIVVWLEPVAAAPPASTPQTLTIAAPGSKTPDDASVRVAAIGDKLVLQNRSQKADTFYLRDDDGTVSNIGTLGAGQLVAYILKKPGPQSIVSDSLDRVIDRLFVVPSPLYKVSHCNATLTFNDLSPGQYQLKSWHYRLPGTSTSLTLAAGKVAKSTVIIGVNTLPKVQ
jgi:hypothetical protein